MELEQLIFEIISYTGEARAQAYAALDAVRRGEDETTYLAESQAMMTKAHNIQTTLVQAEINGEAGVKPTLLLIHAQDQLMTTMAERALIEQMIVMQKELNALKQRGE